MPNLGEKLKQAREEKNISLDKANQETKIHLSVLSAFEENKFDALSPTYIKSFLKKYAEYLKLNEEEVLNEYMLLCPQKATVLLEPVTTSTVSHKDKEERKAINLKPLIKKTAIVAVSVIAAYFLIIAGHKLFVGIGSKIKTAPKKTKLAQKPQPKQNFPVISAGTALKLTMATSDEVWMQVKCDGKTVFQNILPKGSVKKLEAQKSIELWTGKGHALSLDLNGYNLGSPGQGVIKNLVITREGMSKK
ncbi:MAG: RodZ domain-containing protein [Candidatus Omnitrophota bacterium]